MTDSADTCSTSDVYDYVIARAWRGCQGMGNDMNAESEMYAKVKHQIAALESSWLGADAHVWERMRDLAALGGIERFGLFVTRTRAGEWIVGESEEGLQGPCAPRLADAYLAFEKIYAQAHPDPRYDDASDARVDTSTTFWQEASQALRVHDHLRGLPPHRAVLRALEEYGSLRVWQRESIGSVSISAENVREIRAVLLRVNAPVRSSLAEQIVEFFRDHDPSTENDAWDNEDR